LYVKGILAQGIFAQDFGFCFGGFPYANSFIIGAGEVVIFSRL
jgi:hypothetical protein